MLLYYCRDNPFIYAVKHRGDAGIDRNYESCRRRLFIMRDRSREIDMLEDTLQILKQGY